MPITAVHRACSNSNLLPGHHVGCQAAAVPAAERERATCAEARNVCRVQYTAILGVVTALANLVFIEPACTKVMFARYDLENSHNGTPPEAERKELTKKFGASQRL